MTLPILAMNYEPMNPMFVPARPVLPKDSSKKAKQPRGKRVSARAAKAKAKAAAEAPKQKAAPPKKK